VPLPGSFALPNWVCLLLETPIPSLWVRVRVLKLKRRVQLLIGIVQLLFVVVRLFGCRLDYCRDAA
jgi:hypothetical protein